MPDTKLIFVDPTLEEDVNGISLLQNDLGEASLSEVSRGEVFVDNLINESVITLRDKKGMAIVGIAPCGEKALKKAKWFDDFIKAFKKKRGCFEADSKDLFLHVLAKKGNDKVSHRLLQLLSRKSGRDIKIQPDSVKLYDRSGFTCPAMWVSFNTSEVIYNIDPADGWGGIQERRVL